VQIRNIIKTPLKRLIMSEEITTATPKGEAVVRYCAVCGCEFDEVVLTNNFFKCASCESIIQVKTKSGD